MNKKKIIYFITEDWYFWSHRLPIARASLKSGMDVSLITRVNNHADRIINKGIRLIPFYINRSSLNPFKDLITLVSLIRVYMKEKPDIVHHVALKPVIYGSWAARIAGIPTVVNAFAGLGEVSAASGLKFKIIKWLMNLSFKSILSPKRFKIIFQNTEDRQFLLDQEMITSDQACLIRGSGVDTESFIPETSASDIPIVILAGRMLWSKGVGDFVEIAKRLKSENINVRMLLVGSPDEMNPTSVSRTQLTEWKNEKTIEWREWTDDMPSVLKESSIAVLPSSYGEGIPKFLIEAASSGLPIVTYDVPGCREIVRNNENGFLIPINNIEKMIHAVKTLIQDPDMTRQMGQKGRKMVINEFSEEIVVKQTLGLYDNLLQPQ